MGREGWLGNLKSARTAQLDWLAWLQSQLPEELRAAAVNAIPKGSELVVLAGSAAWSARLRYALAALEPAIRARAPQLVKITVKVAP